MKSIATVVALASALLFGAWNLQSLNAEVDQTNFALVNSYGTFCSGTLLDQEHGLILTASHCVKQQYEVVEHDKIDPKTGQVKKVKIRIARPGTVAQINYAGPSIVQKNEFVFKLVAMDTDVDLALIKVQAKLPNHLRATLACTEPARGEQVWAVGNAFGVLYSTVTKGIVSNLHRSYRDLGIAGDLGDATDVGDHGLIQHSAVIAPGNSGGALYNDAGQFAGVNVRGIPGGFGFAVPLKDIRKFLIDNGEADLVPACTNATK